MIVATRRWLLYLDSVNTRQTENNLIPNTLLLTLVIYSIYILHVRWNVLYIYYIK